jgi:hypothetical protein
MSTLIIRPGIEELRELWRSKSVLPSIAIGAQIIRAFARIGGLWVFIRYAGNIVEIVRVYAFF